MCIAHKVETADTGHCGQCKLSHLCPPVTRKRRLRYILDESMIYFGRWIHWLRDWGCSKIPKECVFILCNFIEFLFLRSDAGAVLYARHCFLDMWCSLDFTYRKIELIILPPFYQWRPWRVRGHTGHAPRAHLKETMHQELHVKMKMFFRNMHFLENTRHLR